MRGATGITKAWTPSGSRDFNPRSSCEERPDLHDNRATSTHFNPRSSCEERRDMDGSARAREQNFNPRSSCEERPGCGSSPRLSWNFNPRSSCEERRVVAVTIDVKSRISIHAPHARSDKQDQTFGPNIPDISIHAPHARSDCSRSSQSSPKI